MQIERLGPTDPIQNSKANARVGRGEKADRADSINLSSEAQEMGELYQATEAAKAAPDVRADRVAELKAKINDPSYIDQAVVSLVADRVMEQFGL
jgi:negative regulator of flagellin synthesis FlgM